ncbi:hypothetical protein [Corynebacterium dentalis]|uniref:hypothetical protein n=1 Tax=Corynebacterium dentalis TaxID=2014528 RepID=UPI00289B0C62|nr:hypothetical protein [Corynebacterium dentalis]
MPIWGAVVLALGVALLTQLCTFVIQERRLNREEQRRETEIASDRKENLDHREHLRLESQAHRMHEKEQKRREEWIKSVRWAADHVASGSDLNVLIGVRTLDALDNEPDLTVEEQAMIDAILSVVASDLEDTI